ncbi:MAG: glycosyltransferase, partial [Alphaproteobacteria bacterium]|nr:glycosyltransferase [Alphaproteobacteria bacterium]
MASTPAAVKLSVIIPAYNEESYLPATLDSVNAAAPMRSAQGSGRFRGGGSSRTALWPAAGHRETGDAGRDPGAP